MLFKRKRRRLDPVETLVLSLVHAHERVFNRPLVGRGRLIALAAAAKFLGKKSSPFAGLPLRFHLRSSRLDSAQIKRAIFYLQEAGLLQERSVHCNREVDECDDANSVNIYATSRGVEKLLPPDALAEAERIVREYGDKKPSEILKTILRRYKIPEYYALNANIPLDELIAMARYDAERV